MRTFAASFDFKHHCTLRNLNPIIWMKESSYVLAATFSNVILTTPNEGFKRCL